MSQSTHPRVRPRAPSFPVVPLSTPPWFRSCKFERKGCEFFHPPVRQPRPTPPQYHSQLPPSSPTNAPLRLTQPSMNPSPRKTSPRAPALIAAVYLPPLVNEYPLQFPLSTSTPPCSCPRLHLSNPPPPLLSLSKRTSFHNMTSTLTLLPSKWRTLV